MKRLDIAVLIGLLWVGMMGGCTQVATGEVDPPTVLDADDGGEEDAVVRADALILPLACGEDSECPAPPDSSCQVARCDVTGHVTGEGQPRGCSWITAPVDTPCRVYPGGSYVCPGTCQLAETGDTVCEYVQPVNCGGGS